MIGIHIREIREDDAEQFLTLCKQADAESRYLLFREGERDTTLEEQLNSIQSFLKSENSIIFVVEDEGSLVGYLLARGGAALKNCHSVYIVIAILKSHVGMGIGTKLFVQLEAWARSKDISRLELGVMEINSPAFNLYRKLGFETEGLKRKAFYQDGAYVDEYIMAKLI